MPTYEYGCHACEHKFDYYQSANDPVLTKCPLCSVSGKIDKLISVPLMVFAKGDPKTVGELAERNTKKMGKDQVSLYEEKQREAKRLRRKAIAEKLPKGASLAKNDSHPLPPWRDGSIPGLERSDKPLELIDNVSNIEKFVMTGKK